MNFSIETAISGVCSTLSVIFVNGSSDMSFLCAAFKSTFEIFALDDLALVTFKIVSPLYLIAPLSVLISSISTSLFKKPSASLGFFSI